MLNKRKLIKSYSIQYTTAWKAIGVKERNIQSKKLKVSNEFSTKAYRNTDDFSTIIASGIDYCYPLLKALQRNLLFAMYREFYAAS